MIICLVCVGKTDDRSIVQLLDEYEKRVSRYGSYMVKEIPALKKSSSLSKGELKIREGELILKQITKEDYVVLLDERGKEFRSIEFASFLNKRFLAGGKRLCFVIGGAFGVDEMIKKRADHILSLSKMTFPHQLVRLIFTEQLYRAQSILRNEAYHHD